MSFPGPSVVSASSSRPLAAAEVDADDAVAGVSPQGSALAATVSTTGDGGPTLCGSCGDGASGEPSRANGSSAADEDMASCPICFGEFIGGKTVAEVGALTFQGKRVERSLYHVGCITMMLFHKGSIAASADGSWDQPQISWGLSPMTRTPVDGFSPMPSLEDADAWAKFVDWRGAGSVAAEDLSLAISAVLPFSEEGAESLVREICPDCTGGVLAKSVKDVLLPELRRRAKKLGIATGAEEREAAERARAADNEKAAERYAEILCDFLECCIDPAFGHHDAEAVLPALKALREVSPEGSAPRAAKVAIRWLQHRAAKGGESAAEQVRQAARALLQHAARRGDTALLSDLAPVLEDRNELVRLSAVQALQALHGSSRVTALLNERLLRDRAPKVRVAAAAALMQAAAPGDVAALDSLGLACGDADGAVKEKALLALSHVAEKGDKRAIGVITAQLQHSDFKVRRNATAALGKVAFRGDAEVLRLVYGMMKESDPDVRWGGVCALAHIAHVGDCRAIKALSEQAVQREFWLRSAVMNALGQLVLSTDYKGTKVVQDATKDSDMTVRRAAEAALERIKGNTPATEAAVASRSFWRCCSRRIDASSPHAGANAVTTEAGGRLSDAV